MERATCLEVSFDMYQWLAGSERPFTVHSMSHDALYINPKQCYNECVHAMNNGCIEAHYYDTHPFAYKLLIISRDQADAGVEIVVLYSEKNNGDQ